MCAGIIHSEDLRVSQYSGSLSDFLRQRPEARSYYKLSTPNLTSTDNNQLDQASNAGDTELLADITNMQHHSTTSAQRRWAHCLPHHCLSSRSKCQ